MGRGNERTRPNRFQGVFYNGDWHTKLLDALQLAKAGTSRPELLTSIFSLESQLAKIDECIHTVTVIQRVPPKMSSEFLLRHIERCVDIEPTVLCLTTSDDIELTVTARGDHDVVLGMAKAILLCGLRSARSAWLASLDSERNSGH